MTDENQKPLTGQKLLDKIAELSDLPRIEIAKICGYFTVIEGEKKVDWNTDLMDFYEAVWAAREGISISELRLEQQEHFTRPWPERRGMDTYDDRKTNIVLVRVSLDELSATLADLAVEWQRDVIGSIVKPSYRSSFAFQIVGQKWSIATPLYLTSGNLALLSKKWQQPIIEMWLSDEGYIGYQLYESGELVETFDGYEGIGDLDPKTLNPQTKIYKLHPYPEDPQFQQTVYFWSKSRQIKASEMKNRWDFLNQLLLDYQAYDPGIDDRYFLAENYRVENPGLTTTIGRTRQITTIPEFVRVDYFIFASPR